MSITQSGKVGIVMGSDSDWQAMKVTVETLAKFNVPCEVNILSAHRCPQETAEYAASARSRGLEVLIAGAGMAAHLAGTLAANTTLPVIGVPIDSGCLQGIDALLSTVQMPPGVPVAAVGIGAAGAQNAALLAVQILALGQKELAGKFEQYKAELAQAVKKKNEKMQREFNPHQK